MVVHEGGDIVVAWSDIDLGKARHGSAGQPVTLSYEQGGGAAVGVENANGTVAFQYPHGHPVIVNGRGLLLHPVTS